MSAEDTAGDGVDETVPASSTVDATRSATIDHAQLARAMATTPPPGHVDLSQSTVGRYRVVRQLGAGGMGVVYEAIDPSLDRRVALKLMRRRGRAARASDQARFAREAKALAKLQHPNVVSVYDAGDSDHGAFVVMSLVDGETLAQRIARGPLPWPEAVAIATAAARGLAAAHAVGIVHRDVKPSNILLEKDGTVRVGDFGLACSVEPEDQGADGLPATGAGAAVGTPRYMAFEQHQARAATARSDQFSLCVTLYEAVYGAHPFAPPSRDMTLALAAMRADAVRPPPAIRVPRRIARALRRGLRCEPGERFPSMEALIAALAPRRRSRPMWAAVAVAVAVAAIAIAAMVVRRATPAAIPSRHTPTDALQVVRLTRFGDVSNPEISPDGRTLAYVRDHSVYVRDLAGGGPDRLVASSVEAPTWSPRGDRLAVGVVPGQRGRVLSLSGEVVKELGEGNWDWASDDELINFGLGGKYAHFRDLHSEATRKCRIPGDYEWLRNVEVSKRSGRAMAATSRGSQLTIWTFQRDCSEMRALLVGRNAAVTFWKFPVRWSADGDGVIVPVTSPTGGVQLQLVPLAWPWVRRTRVEDVDLKWYSVSRDGALFYDRHDRRGHVWKVARDGALTRLTEESRSRNNLARTADATAVTFMETSERGRSFVYQPLDGRPASSLLTYTHAEGFLMSAALSPDQREIAAIAYDDGRIGARVIARDGASPRSLDRMTIDGVDGVVWEGDRLFFYPPDHRNLLMVGRDGARSLLVADPSVGWILWPTVSPDGRTVAVMWNRSPYGVWTIGLEDHAIRLIGRNMLPAGWSSDGAWIYAITRDRTQALRLPSRGGDPLPWFDIRAAGAVSEVVAMPDGSAAILLSSTSSDLFILPGVAR